MTKRTRRSTRSNRSSSKRITKPGRDRRLTSARRPRRGRLTRIAYPAAAFLLGCGTPCNPPDGGPRTISHAGPVGPTCPDVDMTLSPDMGGDACSMWLCKQDADCPPTLCPTAYGFGTCRSGTCVWK